MATYEIIPHEISSHAPPFRLGMNNNRCLHQFGDVDGVLESFRPVLVREAALADISLEAVQHGAVIVSALQSLVTRHFGVELVDAGAEHESARVEGEVLALLVGVLATLQVALLDDGHECFHCLFVFSDVGGTQNEMPPQSVFVPITGAKL